MFQTVLITNRGDHPRSGAATKSKCRVGVAHHGDLATEATHV
ncbi:hypothetical protein [Pseudomonas flexibilis]|nr:hypothetical protein [Pseudomonas flexibilis]